MSKFQLLDSDDEVLEFEHPNDNVSVRSGESKRSESIGVVTNSDSVDDDDGFEQCRGRRERNQSHRGGRGNFHGRGFEPGRGRGFGNRGERTTDYRQEQKREYREPRHDDEFQRGGYGHRGGRGGRGFNNGGRGRGGGNRPSRPVPGDPDFVFPIRNIKPAKPEEYPPEIGEDTGEHLHLSSTWKVYEHVLNSGHTKKDYRHVWTIDTVASFWQFFNNFHGCDLHVWQYYIMREDILPIREDNANRKGGNYSTKVDGATNARSRNSEFHGTAEYQIDLSIEAFITITLLMVNETLISNKASDNQDINGISYMIRNGQPYFKIWYSVFDEDVGRIMPMSFFATLEAELSKYNQQRTIGPPRKFLTFKNIEVQPKDEEVGEL